MSRRQAEVKFTSDAKLDMVQGRGAGQCPSAGHSGLDVRVAQSSVFPPVRTLREDRSRRRGGALLGDGANRDLIHPLSQRVRGGRDRVTDKNTALPIARMLRDSVDKQREPFGEKFDDETRAASPQRIHSLQFVFRLAYA